MFLTWLASSQARENFFRRLRSMSTAYSTIVNTILLEIFQRIERIFLQEDISSGNLNKKTKLFQYPRAGMSKNRENQGCLLPNTDNIIKTIENAKTNAFLKVKSVGMNVNFKASDEIFSKLLATDYDDFEGNDNDDEVIDNDIKKDEENDQQELWEDLSALSNVQGGLDLKTHEKSREKSEIQLHSRSPFVVARDQKKNELVVRKSSLCWLCSTNSCNLSSDRLQRVEILS